MDKDVFVTIKGIHTANNESDDTEILIPGEYYYRNNKHFICYEEVSESNGERSRSVMKISDNMVELIKRGSGSSHLIFEKDKKIILYTIPGWAVCIWGWIPATFRW